MFQYFYYCQYYSWNYIINLFFISSISVQLRLPVIATDTVFPFNIEHDSIYIFNKYI